MSGTTPAAYWLKAASLTPAAMAGARSPAMQAWNCASSPAVGATAAGPLGADAGGGGGSGACGTGGGGAFGGVPAQAASRDAASAVTTIRALQITGDLASGDGRMMPSATERTRTRVEASPFRSYRCHADSPFPLAWAMAPLRFLS